MRSRGFHHVSRFAVLGLFMLWTAAPAARAAAFAAPETENRAAQIENLLGEVLGSNLATPQYADHGGGLHSLFVPLDAQQTERLGGLLREGDGVEGQAGPAYYFLAGGQSLTPPTSPSAMIHAALSNTRLGYNYWVIVVNLGTDVTRNTTFKLTGPGRTFNRTFSLQYRANGIWTYWFTAPSVNTAGFYHFLPTVAGAGTFAIHTFAVNP
ncbi:MAG TPA: hypothetical protein VN851_02720 [Thermoanaerobaculia bacterium]|nr:hypothetical protein [Thermoanaerobaculia bacterium]